MTSHDAKALLPLQALAWSHLRLAEQAKKLSAFDEIHDHVKILCILESAPKCDQKRMFDPLQHFPLIVCVLNLLHLHHLLLLQDFHGIISLVVF